MTEFKTNIKFPLNSKINKISEIKIICLKNEKCNIVRQIGHLNYIDTFILDKNFYCPANQSLGKIELSISKKSNNFFTKDVLKRTKRIEFGRIAIFSKIKNFFQNEIFLVILSRKKKIFLNCLLEQINYDNSFFRKHFYNYNFFINLNILNKNIDNLKKFNGIINSEVNLGVNFNKIIYTYTFLKCMQKIVRLSELNWIFSLKKFKIINLYYFNRFKTNNEKIFF